MLDVARDMTTPGEGGAWTERVAELRSTLLRKTDLDDVPVKPQRVYNAVNEVYGYDEDYAVDLAYKNGETVGIDHVGVMEAMGALGRRVTEPGDVADTLRWAVDTSEEHQPRSSSRS